LSLSWPFSTGFSVYLSSGLQDRTGDAEKLEEALRDGAAAVVGNDAASYHKTVVKRLHPRWTIEQKPTLTVLNSSHSARTKFMCLSYASICPTSDRPSFLLLALPACSFPADVLALPQTRNTHNVTFRR